MLIASASSSSASIKNRVPVKLIRHLGIHPPLHGELEGGQPHWKQNGRLRFKRPVGAEERGDVGAGPGSPGLHKCATTAGFNNRAETPFINCSSILLDL